MASAAHAGDHEAQAGTWPADGPGAAHGQRPGRGSEQAMGSGPTTVRRTVTARGPAAVIGKLAQRGARSPADWPKRGLPDSPGD